MSKARDLAGLLSASGDVKSSKLDEFGALKDLSNVGMLPASVQTQLVGPAGSAGADSTVAGPQGATGPAGSDGAAGADGVDGAAGADGVDGVGGVADFVASGTLPNGAPVILKADGTVAAVVQSSTPQSIPAGTEAQFSSTAVYDIAVAFDPSDANKFVLAYKDGPTFGYGTAVVGTVSGTSIVFGAKAVFNSGMTMYLSIAFDPNTAGKFVVAFSDHGNSSYTTAVVGIMSGTSIRFGE